MEDDRLKSGAWRKWLRMGWNVLYLTRLARGKIEEVANDWYVLLDDWRGFEGLDIASDVAFYFSR